MSGNICHPATWLVAAAIVSFWIPSLGATAATDPRQGVDRHLGVVTCAGNTCHGANAPLKDSRVQQNEFSVWHREDKHAKAYTVLFNDASKRMARNLGIAAAHTEKLCLDCHADNVPPHLRGKRFQLEDGVGCEACHGGGERYLGPHVSGSGTHANNVALGLYPGDEPEARAALCLSCHLGTRDQLATHRIMGAGHPRISFELDTFTHIQPAHFRVDQDYRERKTNWNGVQVWAIGQVLAAERFLELFLEPKYQAAGVMPELAFFDCHACHRPMKKPHWAPRESAGLQPGTIHVNDANLLMLYHLLRSVAPEQGRRLHDGLRRLHHATTVGMKDSNQAAAELRPLLGEIRETLRQRPFSPHEMRALAADLVRAGERGDYNDYGAAEQAAMALGAIGAALRADGALAPQQAERMDGSLKELDGVFKDDHAYDPNRMFEALKALGTILR